MSLYEGLTRKAFVPSKKASSNANERKTVYKFLSSSFRATPTFRTVIKLEDKKTHENEQSKNKASMETPRVFEMSFSTPSSSMAPLAQPPSSIRSEYEILQEVSRMTLHEPKEPRTPHSPFQTPIIRKRKPSCVTPPQAQAFAPRPQECHDGSRMNVMLPPMGLPPMLPSSPAMDECSSITNPFTRHRPLHSPFSGVSALNLDFVATLNAEEEKEEDRAAQPVLRRRIQLNPRTDAAVLLGDAFPDLEDDEAVPARALKMRRRSPEFDTVNDISM